MADACDACGRGPLGVTIHPEMDGWSCPNCGHYNEIDEDGDGDAE